MRAYRIEFFVKADAVDPAQVALLNRLMEAAGTTDRRCNVGYAKAGRVSHKIVFQAFGDDDAVESVKRMERALSGYVAESGTLWERIGEGRTHTLRPVA